ESVFIINLSSPEIHPANENQLRSDVYSTQSPLVETIIPNLVNQSNQNSPQTSLPSQGAPPQPHPRRPSIVQTLRTLVSSRSRRGSLYADLSQRRMTELKFRELLTDPLTDQNLNFFQNYFNEDISVKQFDITQFCRLLQITPVLGTYLF
ncbi:unnamed protein product, partial [Didymodactylos carnosus]